MKRTFWHIPVILVLLASPMACARPTRQREAVTITFACRDYQRDRYEELAQAFHKEHSHITVQILSVDEILDRP